MSDDPSQEHERLVGSGESRQIRLPATALWRPVRALLFLFFGPFSALSWLPPSSVSHAVNPSMQRSALCRRAKTDSKPSGQRAVT
jgi:hypothetical protein